MTLGFLVPPRAFAAELPREAQAILDQSGLDVAAASGWQFSDLVDTVWGMVCGTFSEPVRFCVQCLAFLLLSGAAAMIVGRGDWQRCVDAVCVLGFGAMSLGAMMRLTDMVCTTAQDCQTYLIAFVPVYSGAAVVGGQGGGAAVYSTMFFAMSTFLSGAIRVVLMPVMQIYFCFSVSAAVWGNAGIDQAASLFARCLSCLLKWCGALFSLVLGLQNMLAASVDNTALRMGRSVLSGMIPVVGDAAAVALTGAAGAVQLLKGSLALALTAAMGGAFLPVFVRCALYFLAFSAAGILAAGIGQKQCGQICRSFAEGSRLCGSVLTLYFFMVFLSTALLLITGTGGN